MIAARLTLRVAVLAAVSLLAACSGSTAELSGTVVYAGKRLTYGKVIVIQEDGLSKNGEIQPDGSYAVAGLRPGKVIITVYNQLPQLSGRAGTGRDRPGSGVPEGWFEIPDKYADQERSGLETTLTSGKNTFTIDLR